MSSHNRVGGAMVIGNCALDLPEPVLCAFAVFLDRAKLCLQFRGLLYLIPLIYPFWGFLRLLLWSFRGFSFVRRASSAPFGRGSDLVLLEPGHVGVVDHELVQAINLGV